MAWLHDTSYSLALSPPYLPTTTYFCNVLVSPPFVKKSLSSSDPHGSSMGAWWLENVEAKITLLVSFLLLFCPPSPYHALVLLGNDDEREEDLVYGLIAGGTNACMLPSIQQTPRKTPDDVGICHPKCCRCCMMISLSLTNSLSFMAMMVRSERNTCLCAQ